MYGVRLRVFGDYACFTRPEMKAERVSYDVPTPSALRGILESLHWKPAIQWRIDAVHVMKPIRFESIRRNELGNKTPVSSVTGAMKKGSALQTFIEDDRQQRAGLILKDVEYCVEAHFVLTDKAGSDDSPGKHLDIFNRRLRKGQVWQRPCLGCREFPAHLGYLEAIPPSPLSSCADGDRDLGWMLYDIDYTQDCSPMFFRASLHKGVMSVPPPDSAEVRR